MPDCGLPVPAVHNDPDASLNSTPDNSESQPHSKEPNSEHQQLSTGANTSRIQTNSITKDLSEENLCDFDEIIEKMSSSECCEKQSNIANPNTDMFEDFFGQTRPSFQKVIWVVLVRLVRVKLEV